MLASPPLRRVELAFLGFSCAEHGVWVSMTVFAYQQGGTSMAAAIAVAQLLPAAAVAPVASRLADRRGGAVGLWAGYVAQALAMGATAALLLTDAPVSAASEGAILAASAVTLTRPSQSALLPTLVEDPAELTAANAVTGWLESVSLFIGPALAGVLLGVSGPGAAFALFASAAGVSAVLVAPIARTAWRRSATVVADADAQGPTALSTLRTVPGAAALVAMMNLQFVAIGALDVLVVVLAIEVLDLGAQGAGYLNAAFGVGGVLGGIGALWLVGRHRLVPPLLFAATAWGASFILLGAWPTVAGAFLLFAGAGAAWTMLDVAGRTLLQRAVPADVRGRVFGVLEGLSMLSLALGSILVPVLAQLGGPRTAVAGVGLLLVAAGVTMTARLRTLDRVTEPADAELALLRASPLFQALAPPVLDDLALAMTTERFQAGDVVLREGEPGDRFYLVGAGHLTVTVRGTDIAELGPGDGFGEIALLRDGIRTSTVTARTPVTLHALARGPFLTAVTGSRQAALAAEMLAAERLETHQLP